jgi:hypothetical protein
MTIVFGEAKDVEEKQKEKQIKKEKQKGDNK